MKQPQGWQGFVFVRFYIKKWGEKGLIASSINVVSISRVLQFKVIEIPEVIWWGV